MKIAFLLFGILISTIGISQITISDTDFPSAADTAMISVSDETTLDLLTTGADVVWDFSTVNILNQKIDTFHAVSSGDILYQLIFNNPWDNPDHVSDYYTPWTGGALGQLGQFGIGIESPVQFTAVLSDKVQNTGIGMNVNGFNVPAKSDTIDVQYELPMNYADSWVSNSYTNLDLNPAFNGIYRRYQQRNSIVDGWGDITTPFGTFEALRVKSLVSATDSLYIEIGGFGSWVELPLPDQIEYDWFAVGQKIPVFSVVTTDILGNETVTSVEFKDKKRDFASTQELVFEGGIYPNPATSQVQISFVELPTFIELYDMQGKLIKRDTPASNQYQLIVSDWRPGVYIMKVYQNEGVAAAKLVIE